MFQVHSTDFLSLFFTFFNDDDNDIDDAAVVDESGGGESTFKPPDQVLLDGNTDKHKVDEKVDRICREWLDVTELPEELKRRFEHPVPENNSLMRSVEDNFRFWKDQVSRKRKRRITTDPLTDPPDLEVSEQLVLLLEQLLAEPRLDRGILDRLDSKFEFSRANADVQHRFTFHFRLIY